MRTEVLGIRRKREKNEPAKLLWRTIASTDFSVS
jgi:hypothetical protein